MKPSPRRDACCTAAWGPWNASATGRCPLSPCESHLKRFSRCAVPSSARTSFQTSAIIFAEPMRRFVDRVHERSKIISAVDPDTGSGRRLSVVVGATDVGKSWLVKSAAHPVRAPWATGALRRLPWARPRRFRTRAEGHRRNAETYHATAMVKSPIAASTTMPSISSPRASRPSRRAVARGDARDPDRLDQGVDVPRLFASFRAPCPRTPFGAACARARPRRLWTLRVGRREASVSASLQGGRRRPGAEDARVVVVLNDDELSAYSLARHAVLD